jgi:hypothetical protein
VKRHNESHLSSINASVINTPKRHRELSTHQLLILISIVSILSVRHACAQALNDYNNKPIFSADELIWCGLDLSHMKINEVAKMGEGEKIKGHVPELLALTNKHYGAKWFSKRVMKRSVISDLVSIQSLWMTMDGNQLMTNQPFSLSEDSISAYVKRYKPTQSAGVGLVLIIESFDKPAKSITGCFTFFDMSTREILDVVEFKGKAGQPGGATSYIDWWWPGIEELFRAFDKKYIEPLLNAQTPPASIEAIQDSINASKKMKQFIGLHLGITKTILSESEIDLMLSDFGYQHSKPGVDIAFTYKCEPSSYFYVKTGVGFVTKNSDMEETHFVYPIRAELKFINVPLMIGFQPINIKNSKAINFGIESGLIGNFDAGSTSNDGPGLHTANSVSPEPFVPSFAFGGNLEIKISAKFMVFVNYRKCKDLVDYYNRDFSYYDYDTQTNISYHFSYRATSKNLTFGVLMNLR